jgi:hypothetical protein
LVGTSSAYSFTTNSGNLLNPYLQVAAGVGVEEKGSLALVVNQNGNQARCPGLFLAKNYSPSTSIATSVTNEALGEISFNGVDGTTFVRAAQIRAEVDGLPGANDMPGRILLSTTGDGESSPTPRMTIKSNGNVGIGTTSPDTNLVIQSSSINSVVKLKGTSSTNGGQLQVNGTNLILRNRDNGELQLWTNDSPKAVIDSSGNFGIGTTSPAANLEVSDTSDSVLQVTATDASTAYFRLKANGTDELQFYSNQFVGGDITVRSNKFLRFGTNNIERLRITSTGLVGIGTTSPQALLHLNTDGTALRIQRGSALGYLYHTGTSQTDTFRLNSEFGPIELLVRTGQDIRFSNSNSEFVRIDSSGKLLVGTTSVRAVGSGFNPQILLETPNSGIAGFAVVSNRGDAFGPSISLGKSRAPSVGGTTVVAQDDILGEIRFAGADGTDVQTQGASIRCRVDGTPGANDMPGRLVFSTTADGASSPTERMTIKNDGKVGIGTNAPAYKLEVNGSFAATTKSFVIDHPTKEGKKLRYGSLEGPENGVYVRGKSTEFVIELPEYWTKLVDEDSITVNLTAIGKSQSLWVKDIKDNKIYIGSKCTTVKYFYTVFGERCDVEKLEVEY